MSEHSPFPIWLQFAAVAAYFACDLILRFCYQAVLDGPPPMFSNDDEAYVAVSYSKPTFLVLCCYMTFFLWGPCLVFPYLVFVRKISVLDYYQNEWSGRLGFWMAFRYTCGMAIILFLGNLGYVAGLRYISVALGSALSQGEAPFTVVLAVLILGRIFGTCEKIGIALSFVGIALIAIPPVLRSKDSNENNALEQSVQAEIGGIISTLCGAFGFGAYQIFWPVFDEKRYDKVDHPRPAKAVDAIIDALATLTLVGGFLISTGWLLIVLVHVLGIETFEMPPPSIRGTLVLSSVISAFTDALNGVACVIATAVIVALAYPLIIPLSVILQYFIDGIPVNAWGYMGWIGTIFVISGVSCLEYPATEEHSDQQTDTSSMFNFVELDPLDVGNSSVPQLPKTESTLPEGVVIA